MHNNAIHLLGYTQDVLSILELFSITPAMQPQKDIIISVVTGYTGRLSNSFLPAGYYSTTMLFTGTGIKQAYINE
jgi:hypothetical protein